MTAFFFYLLIIMIQISVRKPQAWWMENLIGYALLNISIFDCLIRVGKRQNILYSDGFMDCSVFLLFLKIICVYFKLFVLKYSVLKSDRIFLKKMHEW